MGLQRLCVIGAVDNIEVPVPPAFAPAICLGFAGNGAFQRYVRILFFELQHRLGCVDVHTHRHAGDEVRHAVFGDLLFNALGQQCLEPFAAFRTFVVTEGQGFRSVSCEAASFVHDFSVLLVCVLASVSNSLIHSLHHYNRKICRNKVSKNKKLHENRAVR